MASTGSLPTTGVVLAALDEFSGTMKAYVEGLSKVGAADDAAAGHSARAAAKTQQLGEQHKLGAEKMARYALGAGIVTGQLQQMGIGADKVMLPLSILMATMTEGFNPTGLVMIGLGAIASAILNMATAERRANDAFLSGGAQLEQLADQTNSHSKIVRDLTEQYHKLTRAKMADIQADILKQKSGDLSLWQETKLAITGQMDAWMGLSLTQKTAAGIAAEHRAALQTLETQLLQLQLSLAYETDEQKKSNEARQKALDLAKAMATAYQGQLDTLSADVAAHDDAFTATLHAGNMQRKKSVMDTLRANGAAYNAHFMAVTAAAQVSADAQTAAQERADLAEKAIIDARTQFAFQSAAALGIAMGGMLAGQVGAAKQAAYAILDVVKAMVERSIILTGILNPANLLKIALIEAAFAAGKAAIASSDKGAASGGSPASTSTYGGYTATGGGYEGGYYAAQAQRSSGSSGAPPSAAPVTIHFEQHITGDVSPATARRVKNDTEDVLYRVGPAAAQRAAALGRRAA